MDVLQPESKLNINSLKTLSWADMAMIGFFASRFITAVFAGIFGVKGIYLTMALFILLYGLGGWEVWKEKRRDSLSSFFILFFFMAFLAIVSMIFNPEAKLWILDFEYGLITRTLDVRKGIFGALVILLVRRPDRLTRNFEIAAWLSLAYHLIQGALFLISGSWDSYYVLEETRGLTYNLTYGYEMIFVAIVFLTLNMARPQKSCLAAGIIAFLTSFVFGSRGSLVPFLAFLALVLAELLWTNRVRWKTQIRKGLLAGGILLGAGLALLLLIRLAGGAGEGIQLRTGIRNIDMLLSMEFTDDNGRFVIWDHALQAIRAGFPTGLGVYGDRPFVGRDFRWGYSHNFFLEMTASFGILGLLAALVLLAMVIRRLFDRSFRPWFVPLMILAAMNTKLLISDSFWFYDFFWALIGLLIAIGLDRPAFLKKQAESGREKIAPLKSWLLIAALIAANLGAVGFLLARDTAAQRYRTVDFDEPTALIILQDGGREALERGMNEVSRRGLKASLFANARILTDGDMERVRVSDEFDLNVELGYRPMAETDWPLLGRYIDQSRQLHQDSGLDGPLALSTYSNDIFPSTFRYLKDRSDALVLPLLKNQDYYYSSVYEGDLYKLGAINASINRGNRGRLPYVKSEINKAWENNGLIVIYFRNLQIHSENPTGRAMTSMGFFQEILGHLEESGFRFTTMTELLEEARLPEEEKTLRTLITNMEIFRKVFN